MDASIFGYIEATLVFVIVVGWGGRELWLLKRDRESRQREHAEKSAAASDNGDTNS